QTAGRAARNIEGRVIMYADKITKSMQKTIDETNRKREKQIKYNVEHNITPKALNKSKNEILGQTTVIDDAYLIENYDPKPSLAADPVVKYMNKEQLQKLLEETQSRMKKAAKQEDFIEAARLRDEMMEISKMIKNEA
ncbi:MAG TPA: UvrB/UvrC motif-containing protein, partial [Vicingus sp.]|nr:UvrB/UvrC motif-containing protein [Vicingus sp.]